jgi:copper chaperone
VTEATAAALVDIPPNGILPSKYTGGDTMSQRSYTVTGMTCAHCVASVTEEISEIDGVTDVAVELATGAVIVTSTQRVDDADIRTAVEEAGYRLAG